MQEHIGNFLKEVIVNQGIMMKDFASMYKTTPSHFSDILGKKDLSTSIIRKFEDILSVEFHLVSGIEKPNVSELPVQHARIRTESGAGGRPVEFKPKSFQEPIPKISANPEVLIKEIEGLKALLESKDQIIKSKDDLIQTLIANKI